MAEPNCHASEPASARARCKHLILKVLGVKRVAGWCGVAEDTVYQWLGRGTEDKPIPTDRVAEIINGAQAAGLEAPLPVLWPAMSSPSRSQSEPLSTSAAEPPGAADNDDASGAARLGVQL